MNTNCSQTGFPVVNLLLRSWTHWTLHSEH